jgi:hypothetical protein
MTHQQRPDGRYRVDWHDAGDYRHRKTVATEADARELVRSIEAELAAALDAVEVRLLDIDTVLSRVFPADKLEHVRETILADPTSDLGQALRTAVEDRDRITRSLTAR